MNKMALKKSKVFYIIRALLFSYILTIIILLILSLLVYKADISSGTIRIGIILSYILSTFLGGLIIGKGVGEKKYLWGMGVGILYFLLILIVSIVLNKSNFSGSASMITVFIMCTLGGTLGGMLS
ncbi:putative membrane protein (TIGR04086 family) [Mobilisporobacter senegalensis]|uniref:Putative membrane protein (TIGR04086 family) n=1 Tax=Mobilisporobacter senegalensis TaxID=1329262 RepID=A0A3N1XGL1_9FIRM|nr:TIGR04086 family membrane protein [Mobilisporobacter senegalensis]ROR25258.1 putative membrane protein (TIGR04086 family) [Mobilisporobacter senegalensis]